MNLIVLTGRIATDPDIRESKGKKVANFNLAVDRRTEKKETDFIRCTAFSKTAEVIENWCFKGQQVGIKGRIQTGSYTDKEGRTIYTTDIIIELLDIFEFKPKTENNEADPDDGLPY